MASGDLLLPVEDIDRADIAFISTDEDWLSADCYQIPVHTRRQHRVVICNRNDKDKLMFRPCLYMLPLIYREDDVEEMTKKLVLILQNVRCATTCPQLSAITAPLVTFLSKNVSS